jgi:hypothetical protein
MAKGAANPGSKAQWIPKAQQKHFKRKKKIILRVQNCLKFEKITGTIMNNCDFLNIIFVRSRHCV